MADGSHIPISQVKIGDHVRTGDPTTGTTSIGTVEDIIYGDGPKDIINIDLEPTRTALTALTWNPSRLRATANHPIFSNGGWKRASQVAVGDTLANTEGSPLLVAGTLQKVIDVNVFNLSISGDHTYFISAPGTSRNAQNDILVHNSYCGVPIRVRASNTRQAVKKARSWGERLQRRGYECRTRGACGQGDLYHLDYRRLGGKSWKTIHFGKRSL